MFGFGRGFGRWFGGWGGGWWGGRGFGWGARLGYCPWTGMPRGWRWYGAAPYNVPAYGFPYSAPTYGTMYPATEDVNVLKSQAAMLQEEIRRIEERIKELEGQGR